MTFSFFIGGYFSINRQVTYKAGSLHCNEYESLPQTGNCKVLPVANNPAWQELLRFLQACAWQKNYHDLEVLDGTQWELTFTQPGKKLICSGSNQYPSDFEQFLQLLQNVTAPIGFTIW